MVEGNSITPARAEFVKALFPDLKITNKAALRLDRMLENILFQPIAHRTHPKSIFVPWKQFRFACCGNPKLEREVKARVLVKAPGYMSAWGVGDAYLINEGFYQKHIAAFSSYTPTASSGIQAPYEPTKHPFCPMVPVNLPYMRSAADELKLWQKYLSAETKSKPKGLGSIVDPIRKAEKLKIWSGKFGVGTSDYELCPLKTSPQQRSLLKIERLHASLVTMIDLAVNNNGCIPMSYRQTDTCPRWYSVGGLRSLQSCPKLLRKICLHGCVEYDIESTNQTIALHYALTHNLPHVAIRYLVEHKREFYTMLLKSTGLPPNLLKKILLALGNSAKLIPPKQALQRIGKLRIDHDVVHGSNIRNAIAGIVWDESRFNVKVFMNRYGALYGDSNVQAYAKEMRLVQAHLKKSGISETLNGYAFEVEVPAMLAMYNAMPSALLSTFDAVVCAQPEDYQRAEATMLDATGIPFRLSKTHYK